MSDVKYVLADDGELYPVPEETAELPAWLNFDAEETEDAIPNIKVSLEKPTQYVVIPEVEEPKVEEWRTETSLIREIMTAFVEQFGFIGILTAVILVFFIAASVLNEKYMYFFLLGLIPLGAYIINLLLLCCVPKKYLPKGTQVWIVNYREERVETVTVLKNSANDVIPGENFNENGFTLSNGSDTLHLYGKEIFLSEDAAMQMLAYVQNYNDRMISEYYPEWKNDSNFMQYYKKREGDKYSKADAIIAKAGDGKHFVREYINEMQQKQKQRKQDREEKVAMMKEIQQYKD